MIMADRITSDEEASEMIRGIDYVIPVPLHSGKKKKRGFNQAALLSSELVRRINSALDLDLKHLPECLKRNRSTLAQRSISGEERFGVSAVDNEQTKAEKVQPKMEEPEPAEDIINVDTVVPIVAAQESVKKDVIVKKSEPVKNSEPVMTEPSDAPVFKLQVLASSTKLKPTDPQLKGQKQADYYQEGGLYKYTLGNSTDYQQIYQLRKAQLQNFPQAFIIAFKNGKKMNVQEAIQEYKKRKK